MSRDDRRWQVHANRPWDAARAAEVEEELRRFLQGRLPEYMVPSTIVRLDAMPVSPNGKLDRRQLLAMVPGRSSGRLFIAPRTDLEHRIAGAWQAVLGRDRIGVEDGFFELGGDSIQSIQLMSRINRMGYRLPVAALFQHATVARLARLIESAGPADVGRRPGVSGSYLAGAGPHAARGRSDVTHVYPLSPLQDHMLRRALAHPELGLYVIHGIARLPETIVVEGYERALNALVGACPLFRTSFDWSDPDRPVQLVHRDVRPALTVEDWRDLDAEGQQARLAERCEADRHRGFRLDAPDPPRLFLARCGQDEWLEVLTAHYLRVDGWSSGELSRRMHIAYEETLAGVEPDLEAEDFGVYADWLASRDRDADRRFWTGMRASAGEVQGALPECVLPGGVRFCRVAKRLERERSEMLRTAGRSRAVTLSAICQTAWAVVLGTVTGRSDVLLGVAMSGRPAEIPDIERMIGPFLNFLPFPLHLAPNVPVDELLRTVHDRMLEMAERQWTSLADIARWWSAPVGSPLFDSYFVFQNLPGMRWSQALGYNLSQTEFPLRVEVMARNELELVMQFPESRLDGRQVECWLDLLDVALDAIAGASDRVTVAAVRRRLERAQVPR